MAGSASRPTGCRRQLDQGSCRVVGGGRRSSAAPTGAVGWSAGAVGVAGPMVAAPQEPAGPRPPSRVRARGLHLAGGELDPEGRRSPPHQVRRAPRTPPAAAASDPCRERPRLRRVEDVDVVRAEEAAVQTRDRAEELHHELVRRPVVQVVGPADLLDPPWLITTSSSATSSASSWSWVTNIVVTCTSSCSRRSQSRSSLRTLASSARTARPAAAPWARRRAPGPAPSAAAARRTAGPAAGRRTARGAPARAARDPPSDLGLRSLADLQPEGHVAVTREVLEGGVVLEHEADVPPLRGQGGGVLVLDPDGAGVGPLKAGDHPQQSRLPATARPEQRGQPPAPDVDADVVEGDEVAEPSC